MDFDDDSLDDLLRDSSANKFKKPVVNVVADELFSTPNIQSSRKEKKSALLAELFGPSSTSFGAIESSLEDHEKDAEKSTPVNSFLANSTVQGKQNEEFSFGSYVPSGVAKLTGSTSRPTTSDSPSKQKQTDFFQPSNFSLPQKSVTVDQFVPAGGLLKESLSIPPLEKEPVTSTLQLKFPVLVPESKNGAESSSKSHSELPNPTIPPTLFPKPISKGTNMAQQIPNEQHQVITDAIPFTFPLPKNKPVSKEILDDKNLAIIKDVLDNFSNNFCKRLETFIGKNDNFSDITNCLVELHKSINTATHNWSSYASKAPDRAFEELERRMLTLENRIELTSQENKNLLVRLDFVENQLRENRNESSRIKLDTETVVESHLKWMRETVDNLDKRISTHSSQCKHYAGEESSSRELLQQMQEKLLNFESKLVKSSIATGHQQEETLHLLKAECKWLERQKKKLNSDRKELRVFQKKIQEKQRILDEFSAELSKTFCRLQSQCLAVDARVKKIEKLWTSLRERPEKLSEKDVSKQSFKSSDIQMEDFGLALWKLHVKGDEQKLTEQHNFLQMLNRTVI
ncbi:uncharacterized protein LOC130692047 isoform X2 [Daphnia carinata]|uniref:uncharacterized protein LOC130692047 isoform X2 n=1 Tax=Daphnia carinata TaxID=120202 RepID=UPI00257BE90B|nr:uncharacterized protein LOC130692047 isoform X2 [Daphnia carinata]